MQKLQQPESERYPRQNKKDPYIFLRVRALPAQKRVQTLPERRNQRLEWGGVNDDIYRF